MRILNRVVEMHKDGIAYEADARHVDLIANSLGLTAANAVLNPGIKEGVADYLTSKENESQNCPKVDMDDDDLYDEDDRNSVNRLSALKGKKWST